MIQAGFCHYAVVEIVEVDWGEKFHVVRVLTGFLLCQVPHARGSEIIGLRFISGGIDRGCFGVKVAARGFTIENRN